MVSSGSDGNEEAALTALEAPAGLARVGRLHDILSSGLADGRAALPAPGGRGVELARLVHRLRDEGVVRRGAEQAVQAVHFVLRLPLVRHALLLLLLLCRCVVVSRVCLQQPQEKVIVKELLHHG